MRLKRLLGMISLVALTVFYLLSTHKTESEKLRELHRSHLENSPFRNTKRLSKSERKLKGLPPNGYYEQKWELTMNPSIGRPMPEKLAELQQKLKEERKSNRGGGDTAHPWVDRGPNNIGGRTRGIMFDPNDNTNKRVFAGGVSGGLWVNNDITDANSSWTQVTGIGANISVTTIIYDPNDTNTFYIGSGESYTSGDVVGRGVWKSTDAGVTWTNIFGGPDGTVTNGGQLVNGIFYINDIVARDVGASTELYIAVAGANYAVADNPNNFHGLLEQGLYKSTDNGVNWTRFDIREPDSSFSNPNDIELDINNNIWFTTTRSSFGQNGGKIFRSTDGISFTLIHTIANARRTELEPSQTDANKFWVAANINGEADLFRTTDSFSNVTKINEPDDADNGISSTDYARNQAFYNLPIEADANDNLYVGGIDLFRSSDEGDTWVQISKWSNNPGLNSITVPLVHADHHAIVFRPGNDNQVVFGTDGGIYYSNNILFASFDDSVISSRNKDFNVTQFYYASMSPGTANDILYGGTQDNGTLTSQNSVSGVNSFNNYFSFFSGDGSYSHIDQDGISVPNRGEFMIVGSTFLSYFFVETSVTSSNQAFNNGYTIVDVNEGDFINQADFDDVGNILYANTSVSGTNRFSSFTLGENSATRKDFLNSILITTQPSAFKVSPFDNTIVLIGTRDGKLIQASDVDTNSVIWDDLSDGAFVGSISDIEYGSTNQEIFITFHNYGVTSIFHTTDGGSTWRSVEGDLPDLPVKCILQNPLLPQEVIIGTELGVWRTDDITATDPVWTQSYNGMSDVTVLDLDYRASDNTILAATYGRGLFTSVFTAVPASINDVLTDKKVFTVYPTISDGDFTVYAKNDLGNTKVQIFDISGKQVYHFSLNFNEDKNQPVSVNLKSGVYIVNLIDQNNRKSSGKIIIR